MSKTVHSFIAVRVTSELVLTTLVRSGKQGTINLPTAPYDMFACLGELFEDARLHKHVINCPLLLDAMGITVGESLRHKRVAAMGAESEASALAKFVKIHQKTPNSYVQRHMLHYLLGQVLSEKEAGDVIPLITALMRHKELQLPRLFRDIFVPLIQQLAASEGVGFLTLSEQIYRVLGYYESQLVTLPGVSELMSTYMVMCQAYLVRQQSLSLLYAMVQTASPMVQRLIWPPIILAVKHAFPRMYSEHPLVFRACLAEVEKESSLFSIDDMLSVLTADDQGALLSESQRWPQALSLRCKTNYLTYLATQGKTLSVDVLFSWSLEHLRPSLVMITTCVGLSALKPRVRSYLAAYPEAFDRLNIGGSGSPLDGQWLGQIDPQGQLYSRYLTGFMTAGLEGKSSPFSAIMARYPMITVYADIYRQLMSNSCVESRGRLIAWLWTHWVSTQSEEYQQAFLEVLVQCSLKKRSGQLRSTWLVVISPVYERLPADKQRQYRDALKKAHKGPFPTLEVSSPLALAMCPETDKPVAMPERSSPMHPLDQQMSLLLMQPPHRFTLDQFSQCNPEHMLLALRAILDKERVIEIQFPNSDVLDLSEPPFVLFHICGDVSYRYSGDQGSLPQVQFKARQGVDSRIDSVFIGAEASMLSIKPIGLKESPFMVPFSSVCVKAKEAL